MVCCCCLCLSSSFSNTIGWKVWLDFFPLVPFCFLFLSLSFPRPVVKHESLVKKSKILLWNWESPFLGSPRLDFWVFCLQRSCKSSLRLKAKHCVPSSWSFPSSSPTGTVIHMLHCDDGWVQRLMIYYINLLCPNTLPDKSRNKVFWDVFGTWTWVMTIEMKGN